MDDQFGFSPLNTTWLRGFAGRYGWLDYGAPEWVGDIFLWVVVALASLGVLYMCRNRDVLLRHRIAGLTALLYALGLAIIIGKPGYDYHRITGFVFEQPRYLFPLAAGFSVLVASALSAARPGHLRWVCAGFVSVLCLHDVSGLAVTVARYYG